jgi:hypothetical protein
MRCGYCKVYRETGTVCCLSRRQIRDACMQIVTMIRRLVWPVVYWQPIWLPPEASSTMGQMSLHLPRTRRESRSRP